MPRVRLRYAGEYSPLQFTAGIAPPARCACADSQAPLKAQRVMLVTGGAGFIGANFVHYTGRFHPQYRMIVLDALTYSGNRDNLSDVAEAIEFVHGDVCDRALVDELVGRADVVVHFAAETHVDNSLDDPSPFVKTNIIGTYTVLEAVRNHDKRFHHISSDEVFGDLPLGVGMFHESTAYNPSNPYSATKASSDLLVKAWARSFGTRATISNCANNFGPYQHIEKFIPRQITNVIDGRRPMLYGRGDNVREWTHVDDHSAAIHAIVERGTCGSTYLIGSGEERTNRAIVEEILAAMGRPRDWVEFVEDRPGHDLRYSNDSSRIRAELGWKPVIGLSGRGLAELVDWYVTNEKWWRAQKGPVEVRYAAQLRERRQFTIGH